MKDLRTIAATAQSIQYNAGAYQAQRMARAAHREHNAHTWELAANLFRAAVTVRAINEGRTA
ncbi:hypothetical protein J3169_004405 [Salmonella enterica]|nr:hypothetical protein [Salmonella enterica]